ncbi:hypothetical protein KCP69_10020 [Salmonella enterica subsp. enterica]|nr:hypothetical protein KCP69_10020 [Salmonella enterica subsp. enterica]
MGANRTVYAYEQRLIAITSQPRRYRRDPLAIFSPEGMQINWVRASLSCVANGKDHRSCSCGRNRRTAAK